MTDPRRRDALLQFPGMDVADLEAFYARLQYMIAAFVDTLPATHELSERYHSNFPNIGQAIPPNRVPYRTLYAPPGAAGNVMVSTELHHDNAPVVRYDLQANLPQHHGLIIRETMAPDWTNAPAADAPSDEHRITLRALASAVRRTIIETANASNNTRHEPLSLTEANKRLEDAVTGIASAMSPIPVKASHFHINITVDIDGRLSTKLYVRGEPSTRSVPLLTLEAAQALAPIVTPCGLLGHDKTIRTEYSIKPLEIRANKVPATPGPAEILRLISGLPPLSDKVLTDEAERLLAKG